MEKRILRSVLAAASVAFLATTVAQAQIRVAVEDGTGRGGGAATVAQLNNDTFFNFSATLVSAGDIDTGAELANYDVVVVGGSGFNDSDWTVTMVSALRAFVENGCGVVGTGWVNFDINAEDPWAADMEYLLSGLNIPSTNEFQSGSATLDINSVVHPVTAGLPDFSPGGSFIEVCRQGTEANDTVLGTIVGAPGDLSIMVKDPIVNGRSVYVGVTYMASVTQYDTVPFRTGLPDQLLEQAVAWAACGDHPVPTENTTWGKVKSTFRGSTE